MRSTFDGFTVPGRSGSTNAFRDGPVLVADFEETLGGFSCGPCGPDDVRAATRDWVLGRCANDDSLSRGRGKAINVGSQLYLYYIIVCEDL